MLKLRVTQKMRTLGACNGFTLLEALVALIVFSVGASYTLALLRQLNDYIWRAYSHQAAVTQLLNDVALAQTFDPEAIKLRFTEESLTMTGQVRSLDTKMLRLSIRNLAETGVEVPISLGFGPYQTVQIDGARSRKVILLVKGGEQDPWRSH